MPHNTPHTALAPLSIATGAVLVDDTVIEEDVIRLPVDPGNGVACLVKAIEMSATNPPIPTGTGTVQTIANLRLSTRQDETTTLPLPEERTTIQSLRTALLKPSATDGGGLGVHQDEQMLYFPDGLLIADGTLSLYGQGTPTFGGRVRIYYELVQVGREDFFAALSVFSDQ